MEFIIYPTISPERETSKLRVVYEASSNSPSLNECLEKGPCLIPLILDILVPNLFEQSNMKVLGVSCENVSDRFIIELPIKDLVDSDQT